MERSGMFNQLNYPKRTPENTPYSLVNSITTPQAQQRNIIGGIGYQGYSFAIPAGQSVQNLQIPGDASQIIGVAMSFSDTLTGVNTTLTISINNQTCMNGLFIQYLNVNRLTFPPGYIPLNKLVSATSILNLNFNNGVAAIAAANFIVVYN